MDKVFWGKWQDETRSTFSLPTFVKWPWISLQPRMSFAFLSPICCRPFNSLREPELRTCRIFCLDCSSTDVSSRDSHSDFIMFSLPSGVWERKDCILNYYSILPMNSTWKSVNIELPIGVKIYFDLINVRPLSVSSKNKTTLKVTHNISLFWMHVSSYAQHRLGCWPQPGLKASSLSSWCRQTVSWLALRAAEEAGVETLIGRKPHI